MKKFSKALVNKMYLLEKFDGKGGWTFARIPEVKKDKSRPFGWVRDCGSIDNVEIKGYHLMPMGDGRLFLPVNAQLRKKTRKSAGDRVHIILYPDDKPTEIPPELIDCLQDEPEAFNKFENCSDSERKAYIEWIYSAKTDETRARRILKMIERLLDSDQN